MEPWGKPCNTSTKSLKEEPTLVFLDLSEDNYE